MPSGHGQTQAGLWTGFVTRRRGKWSPLVSTPELTPALQAIGRDAALKHVRSTWQACGPMNAWLDAHVGAT